METKTKPYIIQRRDFREIIGFKVKILKTTERDYHKDNKAIYSQLWLVKGDYKGDRDLIILEPVKPYAKGLKFNGDHIFITTYDKHPDMGKLEVAIQ